MNEVAPRDTGPAVFRLQVDRWRSMGPLERARLADRLSSDVLQLAAAGIRRDRPDVTEYQLRRELVRRRYGAALADAAYGAAELGDA